MLFKKKPDIEPKRLYVLAEHTIELLSLVDAYQREPRGAGNVAKFKLWSFINGILPETSIGKWRINSENPTKIALVEILDQTKIRKK